MALYNGNLNANILYTALCNMIISQRLFDINVATPTLANMLKSDGTLFGDTKLYYSQDIGESYEWGNDAEASSLLDLNRNDKNFCESVTIDKFRQANVTIDQYLTKQAWKEEGAFAQFNGILVASLGQIKKVFENGLINTFVGTQASTKEACNITIDRSDITTPSNVEELEISNRLTGQRIAYAMSNLSVRLADNTRDFNELDFLRAYNLSEMLVVWNAEAKNKILKIDLPMVYNNGNVQPMDGIEIPARYFGNVNTTGGTATANAVRSMVDKQYVGADGNAFTYTGANGKQYNVFTRIGDYLPTGAVYTAGETYTEDNSIVCKVISKEGIPFMSAMEVGTVFYNGRSLTENHYTTWGYNTLKRLAEKPFITIKLGDYNTDVAQNM